MCLQLVARDGTKTLKPHTIIPPQLYRHYRY